jgi:hypothetical protein
VRWHPAVLAHAPAGALALVLGAAFASSPSRRAGGPKPFEGSDDDQHDHEHEHDHDTEHEHHHHDGPHDYVGAIQGYRAEKDAFFKDPPTARSRRENATRSTGLPYYPVNVDLVFEGLALEPLHGRRAANFEIPTSDNKLRPAHRAGTFIVRARRPASATDGLRDRRRPRDELACSCRSSTRRAAGRRTARAATSTSSRTMDGSYAIDFNLAYPPVVRLLAASSPAR